MPMPLRPHKALTKRRKPCRTASSRMDLSGRKQKILLPHCPSRKWNFSASIGPLIPSPVAKVFEVPHKPIPPSLSDKVVYDSDAGSIALKEYLSPEEEEQLKGCFSTEESKKEIGQALHLCTRKEDEYKRTFSMRKEECHSRSPSFQSTRATCLNHLRRPILTISDGLYLLTMPR